jgi:hypothetical protein
MKIMKIVFVLLFLLITIKTETPELTGGVLMHKVFYFNNNIRDLIFLMVNINHSYKILGAQPPNNIPRNFIFQKFYETNRHYSPVNRTDLKFKVPGKQHL